MEDYGQNYQSASNQNTQNQNSGFQPGQSSGYQPNPGMMLGNQLGIDNTGYGYLNSIMSKIKFMTIVGLVILGIYVIAMLVVPIVVGTGLTEGYILAFILLGLGLAIFIIAKMLSGANKIKQSLRTFNQERFNAGLNDINVSVTTQYILTIIYLVFLVIAIFAGLFQALSYSHYAY